MSFDVRKLPAPAKAVSACSGVIPESLITKKTEIATISKISKNVRLMRSQANRIIFSRVFVSYCVQLSIVL